MAVRADRSFTVCTLGYSDPPPTARGELPDDQARRRTERTHRIFLGDHLTGTRGASSVNEFYKKGCQEKSSASTGERGFFLEIQPTVVSRLWRGLACCPFS